MRELSINEVREVNGGNPAVAIVVVAVAKKVAQKAAPHVKTAIQAAVSITASYFGIKHGSSD